MALDMRGERLKDGMNDGRGGEGGSGDAKRKLCHHGGFRNWLRRGGMLYRRRP